MWKEVAIGQEVGGEGPPEPSRAVRVLGMVRTFVWVAVSAVLALVTGFGVWLARKSPVAWLPLQASDATALNALAANAQATLMDEVIENKNNSENYGPGTLLGARVWLNIVAAQGAGNLLAPRIVFLILESGDSVPSVGSMSQMVSHRKKIWFQFQVPPDTMSGYSVGAQPITIRSQRKFQNGDRLVAVLHNPANGTAYGADADYSLIFDGYVRQA